MGAFFTNLHVQADSKEKVVDALKSKTLPSVYVSACEHNWVSVFVEEDDDHDEEVIQTLAKDLSRELAKAVFTFTVHDSDVFRYGLYLNGEIRDGYNSNPAYFHEISEDAKKEVAGRPDQLLAYCNSHATEERITSLLQGKMVFEETRVAQLADLLGIRAEHATIGYADIAEAEPEIQKQFTLIRGTASRSVSPKQVAFDAVRAGRVEALRALIEAGTSVHLKCPGGNLLGYAIASGHPAIVRLLLDHGADPRKVKGHPFGWSSLILAAMGGVKGEIIELLVKAGGDVNEACDIQFSSNTQAVRRVTPLMCAARLYQIDAVKTFLRLGADPEIKDASGKKALDYAAEKKAFLIKHLSHAKDPVYLKDCLNKLEQVIELLSLPAG